MGVVYYANYLVWMEIGRSEYCRALGIRYRDMEVNDGVLLAVAEANCRYSAPARYDDEITVATSISGANRRMVEFAYKIWNERGQTLATGATKHIFLGPDLKPRKLPERYHGYFGLL